MRSSAKRRRSTSRSRSRQHAHQPLDGRGVLGEREARVLDAERVGDAVALLVVLVARAVERDGAVGAGGLARLEHLLGGGADRARRSRPASARGRARGPCPRRRGRPCTASSCRSRGYAHRPALVAEVTLELAEDRRHGERRERGLARGVEAVDRLQQPERGDLDRGRRAARRRAGSGGRAGARAAGSARRAPRARPDRRRGGSARAGAGPRGRARRGPRMPAERRGYAPASRSRLLDVLDALHALIPPVRDTRGAEVLGREECCGGVWAAASRLYWRSWSVPAMQPTIDARRNLRVLIADEDEEALAGARATSLAGLGHEVTPFAVSVARGGRADRRARTPTSRSWSCTSDDEHALALIAEAVEFASGPVIAQRARTATPTSSRARPSAASPPTSESTEPGGGPGRDRGRDPPLPRGGAAHREGRPARGARSSGAR